MSTKKKVELEVEAYGNTWTKLKPAVPEDIANIESVLKVSLPENLKKLLLTCAGGHPKNNYFFNKIDCSEVSMGYILPANENKKISDVLTMYRNLHKLFDFPADLIPFAFDFGAANPFCLNIKTDEVIYWLTDDPSKRTKKVSDSLDEFILGLSESPF